MKIQKLLKQAAINKNEKADIDEIIELDEVKRKLQFEYDNLRAEQNKVSKQIPAMKKAGEDVSETLETNGSYF